MMNLKSLCAFAAAALFAIPASGQNITTVAGSWNIPDKSATTVSIGYPEDVAVDSSGNLYLSLDQSSGTRIYKLNSAGTLTLVAGNGNEGYSGDGGPATNAELGWGGGIAIDTSGNIYIADGDHSVIRKVDASTGDISTVAGNGTSGYTGDGGSATSAELDRPVGVAVDISGNLYIADQYNNVIRRVDVSTGDIATIAGNGTDGYTGDGGPANNAELGEPGNISIDLFGNLYITDMDHNVIRRVDASTGNISTVAGNGTIGYTGDGGPATSAELNGPFGVAVDSSGNIYIADQNNNVIRKVDASSGNISTIAGTGTAGFTGNSGVAITVELDYPQSVAVDNNGNLYIADSSNYAIRRIAVGDDSLSTVAGNEHWGYSGDGGVATSAQIEQPMDAAVDSSGNLYIADAENNVIRKVDAATGDISTVAGNGNPGYPGDGGPATSVELHYPAGVAVDSSGYLYIADTDNCVIRKVDASTGDISTVAGNGTIGYTGDGGPATSAELNGPFGVAVDSSGNLYIADTDNYVIRKVDASTGDISTIAGNGTEGDTGDGSSATSAEIGYITGLALDKSGNLFIADIDGGVIREVILNPADTANYRKITTIAGGGTSTNTSSPLEIYMAPDGVYVDNIGTIFVSDTANYVVYKITGSSFASPASGVISVVAGNGTYGYSGDGGPATGAELSSPVSVTGDSHGNLLIADSDNHLIRSVTGVVAIAQAATPTFSVAAGSYGGAQTVEIADTTANSTIYYTTDGTTPTIGSSVYSNPIAVSSTETIEAIAAANGYFDSPVATAAYTIALPNPTPAIGTLSPAYADQGGTAFTLTVNGAGFVSGSTVYWGSTALATTYVSATQLTASVPATDIASTGTAAITVQSPTPGGGASDALNFEIDSTNGKTYPPTFTTLTATVTAGSSATYPVTLPSSASNVSVTCLNLPTGATCSYSAGTVTIATSSATPAGTYQVTVVFSETITETTTAWILFPFLLLPLVIARKKLAVKGAWITACLGMVVLVATMAAVGCGGGSSSSSKTTTQTEQVTSSAAVTLAIK